MSLRCATFNVLADAYTGYGDYGYVDPELLKKGARTEGLVRVINSLDADVVGIQEAEEPLLERLEATGDWQLFFTPKGMSKPDGCLTLVRPGLVVDDFGEFHYTDKSGHVLQSVKIGQTVIANTHIKWAPADDPSHAGIYQTRELLEYLRDAEQAVILADCNDRPGGPIRQLVQNAGFANFHDLEATAFVNRESVALDLLAVRGLSLARVHTDYRTANIPTSHLPSDHVPIVADIQSL